MVEERCEVDEVDIFPSRLGGGGDVDRRGVDNLLGGIEVDIDVGHRTRPPGRR